MFDGQKEKRPFICDNKVSKPRQPSEAGGRILGDEPPRPLNADVTDISRTVEEGTRFGAVHAISLLIEQLITCSSQPDSTAPRSQYSYMSCEFDAVVTCICYCFRCQI